MSLLQHLKWRYATKKMNGKAVPDEKLQYILEAARYAPSSSGLQPYRLFVIKNRELLAKIQPIAFNQSQITDCSHLLVWAAWDGYTSENIQAPILKSTEERGLPSQNALEYANTLWSLYEPKGKEWHANHSAKQAYISFALAIAAAAEQQVDATPMEGFDNEKMDELLGLKNMNLKSVVILPIGYRNEQGDWLVGLKKVRVNKDEFVTTID